MQHLSKLAAVASPASFLLPISYVSMHGFPSFDEASYRELYTNMQVDVKKAMKSPKS